MKYAVALLLAAVVAAGLHWGTFAAGGSDSYCYLHQAEGWSTGRLQVVEPLALRAPWPDAPLTFAPSGHVPSPTLRGAAVPICPAGLSIVMAPFMAIRAAAPASAVIARGLVFAVVPLFGALLVGAVYVLGSRFAPRVGLVSALVVACSPAFLFQLMQPMSDVPAAALWVLAAACATGPGRRAPLTAGLATSAAILMRPNLLPLGLVVGVFFIMSSGFRVQSDARPSRSPSPTLLTMLAPAAVFAAASAPGCLAVAVIQQLFYGSPFRSGYGPLDTLFGVANVVPNAERFAMWMWQSHTPVWLLGVAAPLLLPGWLTTLLLMLIVANVACYLPYAVFNDWWYLRFLLPGIALLLVLTVATIDAVIARLLTASQRPHGRGMRAATLGVIGIALCLVFVREAKARSVFDLARLESRYERAGLYVATHLPANALVITSWESGSVRFYSQRATLVWDVLDPAWLDRAIAFSRTQDLEPYLLFERWEEPLFRRRFAGSTVAALDWPPAAEVAGQVRIYRPDDREEYRNGHGTPTEYAR